MKKTILVFSVIAALASSCSKDKTDDLAVTQENVVGEYTLVSFTAKTASAPEQNLTDSYFDPCEKDDIMKFKTGGVFEYQDAGTTCSPDGSYTDKWQLEGNKLISPDFEGTVTVLNKNTMVVASTENFNGITAEYKLTLHRK